MSIKYSDATYSPGTDMTVDCLSGSLIISDTLVCCTLLVESGSDICFMMACRQTNSVFIAIKIYCYTFSLYLFLEFGRISANYPLVNVLSLLSQPKVLLGNKLLL